VHEYEHIDECIEKLSDSRIFALTTKGQTNYSAVKFQPQDAFIFGPETRGLPDNFLNTLEEENKLRLPMQASSRSLNLSNTVAVMLFEAWRQNDFLLTITLTQLIKLLCSLLELV